MPNRVQEYYVEMDDGVKLYTFCILPENAEKVPVIIFRSPYYQAEPVDKEALEKQELHGYGFVQQHCRGTGMSEGECIPYINERNDGLKLLEWVRQQEFYNGEIFLCGGSYGASVHYSYMDTDPADVKGAFLAVQDSERYNIIYRNGFFKPGLHGNWAVGMYRKKAISKKNLVPETWLTRPLTGITESIFGELDHQLENELLHPDRSSGFWKKTEGGSDYSDVLNKCTFPVCMTTAWYDIYTGGVLDIWESLPEERKKNCALAVTPFMHAYNTLPDDPDYPECPGGLISENMQLENTAVAWFDHIRKGSELEFFEKGKVKYYTLWENQWHAVSDIQNGAVKHDFYLTQERTLAAEAGSGSITYLYNPVAPAAFKGGCCHNFYGLQLQDAPSSRYDIISFVSDELEEMVCTGKMELQIEVSSTAPDTCFYARVDIVKGEKTYPLRDDIDSICRTVPEFLPGAKAVLKFRFEHHSFRIGKGDRLRLDISSSCFPHFLVHPNRKGNIAEQNGSDMARNTVFMENSRLSIYCDR
ncbi:MAG: CocE/NonD family hydrolase [Lentisphaeria bacterium]|nr:CocE/NonD family hydrolase [Lentisphaeria bacterium]